MDFEYMQGAEPYFQRGNEIGCLIQHGMAASPAEVQWLAQHLGEQGYTVYAPRLPGHGTRPQDLTRIRWQDWLASLVDAYHMLNAQCEKVFFIGHSMGGVLSILLANLHAPTGLVLMGTPMHFSSQRMRFAHLLKYVLPFTDQSDRSPLSDAIKAEQTRRGEAPIGRVRYDSWSTVGVGELYRVVYAAREVLSNVSSPLLLISSEQDPFAPPPHAKIIAEGVSSTHVEQYILPQSGHIIPQDIEREIVFEKTAAFVASLAGGSSES